MRAITARAANAPEVPGRSPVVMSFDALGQSFDLELEPNHRLLSMARQNSMLDGVEIYRGELAAGPGEVERVDFADIAALASVMGGPQHAQP